MVYGFQNEVKSIDVNDDDTHIIYYSIYIGLTCMISLMKRPVTTIIHSTIILSNFPHTIYYENYIINILQNEGKIFKQFN